jgi:hypothetical protein
MTHNLRFCKLMDHSASDIPLSVPRSKFECYQPLFEKLFARIHACGLSCQVSHQKYMLIAMRRYRTFYL